MYVLHVPRWRIKCSLPRTATVFGMSGLSIQNGWGFVNKAVDGFRSAALCHSKSNRQLGCAYYLLQPAECRGVLRYHGTR